MDLILETNSNRVALINQNKLAKFLIDQQRNQNQSSLTYPSLGFEFRVT